jgi:ATP-binding protein involved in chromosome partitioning
MQAPFLGKVPMDPEVRVGGDSGKPIVISKPESPTAKAMIDIAQNVAAKVSVAALSQENEVPINIVE